MNGTRRAAALLSAVLCMGACTANLLPAAANDPSEWMTVTGDVNGDGSFTVSDIVALQKWLLAVPDAHPANPAAGDLDADGTLDDADEATKKYWRGCTSTWFVNPEFTVDGESIVKYIILDEMPYQDQMVSVKRTLAHEMGHCMGLPDYYKYNDDDWEGLRGIAGNERMDDSVGDFCSFSKLMCGRLKDTEVQAYDGSGTQTFTLEDASRTGSCLILPISSAPTDYTSEYFLVEYVSDTGNNSENFYGTSGVRIFHVQSELYTDAWWRTRFRYENYAETYLGNDKIRVLRLVNDNGDFYHTGDTVTYGTTNFAGYDANGYQTVNTGYTITIGELTDAGYTVTVSR